MEKYLPDEKPTYDTKPLKKLISYLLPYWKLFCISGFFLLISSIVDLSFPYLKKIAIDDYIFPARVKLTVKDPSIEEVLKKIKSVSLGRNQYIVDLNKIPMSEQKKLEKKAKFSKIKYFMVNEKNIQNITEKYPSIFEKIDQYYLLPVEKVKEIQLEDLKKIRKKDINGVKIIASILLLLLVLNSFFHFIHNYCLQFIGQKIMMNMRKNVFSHVVSLPISFFDKNPVGRIITRTTNDISTLNEMYTTVIISCLKDFIVLIGVIFVMLKMNLRLTLFILLLFPVIYYLSRIFKEKARKTWQELRAKLTQLNIFLQESLSGIKIIHIFSTHQLINKKFQNVNYQYYKANLNQLSVHSFFSPIIEIIHSVALAAIIWYGGGDVVRENLSLGCLVAFLSYIRMLFRPITDLADNYYMLQSAVVSAERIFRLLDEKQEDKKGDKLEDIKGKIIFKNVTFSYGNADVLKSLNLEINPGEKVAIVGPTGAGKTSIINILLRFYEIKNGNIFLDGKDIRDLDLEFLRSQFSFVPQDVFLFSDNIKNNITLRKKCISDEKVKESLEFVHGSDFVNNLPYGLNSYLTTRGENISMGQRQLLSLSRAITFNRKILVLDEATSNIDTHTESLIQLALKRILKNRTSIIIAHRFSTIKEVDKIVVIDKGKIVEFGTHKELMKKKGFYYYLYMLQ